VIANAGGTGASIAHNRVRLAALPPICSVEWDAEFKQQTYLECGISHDSQVRFD
jgi:hypothetical protein